MSKEQSKEQLQYQKLVLTPVERLIPRLAIPTVLSMMITMIYNLVDAYFVGKLGTSASAAIGIVLGVQSIFQAFGLVRRGFLNRPCMQPPGFSSIETHARIQPPHFAML